MLLRDFTASNDLNGAMQKLDYLKSLGVNAIELMPVQNLTATIAGDIIHASSCSGQSVWNKENVQRLH